MIERVDAFERAVPIAALTGEGIPGLLTAVEHELFETMLPLEVAIPYREGRLISLFHEQGVVETLEHREDCVVIRGRIPKRFANAMASYVQEAEPASMTLLGEAEPPEDSIA